MLTKLLRSMLSGLCLLAMSSPAAGEIVVLTSGRTISVDGHRFDGDLIVLTLRNGGEISCERSVVREIRPDEVPRATAVQEPERPSAEEVLKSTPYGEIIASAAAAHGVDPLLVRAVIQVESNYRPRARSPKGAMGLMQLMPATAREYKVRNPFDPKANIEAGIKHLKSLITRYGALELALAAYNAGEGAVQRFNGIPPYRETRNYVSRILALAGLQ